MFPREFWEQQNKRSGKKKLPSCNGIDKVAKDLKDYITANNDADFARAVNDMVYGGDQKDNLCNLLNAMAFYSDYPEEGLAREMRDTARYLLDICGWLVVTVYKVPFRETYKYVIRGDELVEVKEEERLVFPKEFKTPKAKEILYRTHRKGLINLTATTSEWKPSSLLLAYFAEKCSKSLVLGTATYERNDADFDTVNLLVFEKFFNRRNLKQARIKNKVSKPIGFEKVDEIFEEFD